jgi:hypothetical protein
MYQKDDKNRRRKKEEEKLRTQRNTDETTVFIAMFVGIGGTRTSSIMGKLGRD